MLAFDAIAGNTDRHLENFGFLRSPDSGEYIGMAPLYDFDHVMDASGTDDYLLKQLPYHPEIIRICKQALDITDNAVFRARAEKILKELPARMG